MINFFRTIFVFIILSALMPTKVWACSFFPQKGTSDTPVTIKIGDTYFQIPEKYLYTFKAVPAERENLILPIPHRDYVSLTKTGKSGYNCEEPRSDVPYRNSISKSVDFCGHNDEVFSELKNSASDITPPTWTRDIELANKFHLGKNPCGEEIPLSWDGTNTEDDINEQDIEDALVHKNEQIRKAAEQFVKNKKAKD